MFATIRALFWFYLESLHRNGEHVTTPRSFWQTYRKGATVTVSVPDSDGARILLQCQRPIEASDVKDGVLLPTTWSGIKRRGAKRQSGMCLSLEGAEALHTLLGEAIKDAKKKQDLRSASTYMLVLTSLDNKVHTSWAALNPK
jgi:hypothetical protein